MKIMICGSMSFAKQMLEAKAALERAGHQADVPEDTGVHLENQGFIDDLEGNLAHCIETDVMRKCMQTISESDAILVLNYPKNGLTGYMGTSTLMELAVAYFLNKKLFLLYPPPSPREARWAHEVMVFSPTVLDGNLSRIK